MPRLPNSGQPSIELHILNGGFPPDFGSQAELVHYADDLSFGGARRVRRYFFDFEAAKEVLFVNKRVFLEGPNETVDALVEVGIWEQVGCPDSNLKEVVLDFLVSLRRGFCSVLGENEKFFGDLRVISEVVKLEIEASRICPLCNLRPVRVN